MSKITELRKYADTKEYKTIIEKCKNRAEVLETQIIEEFPDVDNTAVYSNHDVNYQRMEFDIAILEDIKSKSEWASIIREDIETEVDRIKKFLTLGIKDQYGITNSWPVYSELDMKRGLLQDYKAFEGKVEWMIDALEKQDENTPTLTGNDSED